MKDLIPNEISSEVIHIHTFSYAGFFYTIPSVLVGKILQRKIVSTYHGGAAHGFLHKWKLFALPFLNAVDVIITPSGFIKKILREFGVTKKIEIIPNIVDLGSFEYRERNPIRPKLLIARHLEKIYNIECGIRAFQIVKDRFPNAQLKIVGSGSEEKRLKDLVRELRLRNVQFIPRVEHEEMNLVYAGSDILVNPTTLDNFPVNCVEGAASGLPIVSTNVGGIPFIINDGEDGLLVASNDHEDMAKKIIYLLENPKEARRLALNARKVVERRTWEYVRTEYASIFGRK
jgi:glycosyltransferase involved in cell wall biosynthesis